LFNSCISNTATCQERTFYILNHIFGINISLLPEIECLFDFILFYFSKKLRFKFSTIVNIYKNVNHFWCVCVCVCVCLC
jgi:hypothetical protein